MKITIITLNFNGSSETIDLLKSLKEQTDSDFKIIVIDNTSEEADFTNLKNALIHIPTSQVGYPQVVRNNENLGFSGGNNVGICHALTPNQRISEDAAKQSLVRCKGFAERNPCEAGSTSDWVILLNNDIWVEKDFMERLKAVLSVKTGVVGIPLVEGDRVVCCGKIQWLKPTLIHIPTSQVGYPQVYAIGGAVAIHKDVFEKIGLLDEKYFLYFEDADFSVRARRAGFDISIANNLSVHHHVSSSTKKLGSPLLLRYHYRNALYFNLKNGPWYIKLAVWPWSWIIIAKQLVKLVLGKNEKESKAILAGVFSFYQRRYGKI